MTVKRPIAGNYNDQQTMRKTLSGKADSVFAYRSMNPYSVAFDKFKREANENFDEDLWQKAANKGELDQYINLLAQNPKKSSKLAELQEYYGGAVDYDMAMLALSYDTITDDQAEDRFDTNGNLIGNMTQRDLIDKVLENQKAEWDKQILADELAAANFWQKIGINVRQDLTSGANKKPFLAEGGAFGLDVGAGAIRVWNMMQTTVAGLSFAGGKIANGEIPLGMPDTWEQISKAYALATDPKIATLHGIQNSNAFMGTAHLDKIEKDLAALAFDIRRKYSYSIDPATGEYKFWGKILHGMADSIGFMALSMLGGGPAAMYIPMFTQNVRENLQLTGYNTDYSKLMTNAAGKSAVEFAIEWSLGKVFGFTKLDKIAFGYADDAAKIGAKATKAVTKGMTATTGQAIGHLSAQIAKDAFQEGLEEVLQDGSGMFIDYLYGDEYSQRGKDGATLENFGQAFIIGAATSIAIGGFSNLTVAAKTETMTTVGTDGLTYQLGKFQSMVYKEALATMASWQEIANDAKAKPQARLEAALKLEGVMSTLGGLYQSLGIENMAKAETLLLEVQKYHDKKAAIKEKVAKGVYVSDILTEVGGKKWAEAVNLINKATNNLQTDISLMQGTKPGTAYISFTRFLGDPTYQKKLANSGATKVEPVDITGETKEDADKIADDNIYGMLAKMGFNAVVRTDGRLVIVGEDIVVVPDTILDTDTQELLKEVVAQKTIENIISYIDTELLRAVINVYESILGAGHSYSEAEVADMAIAALMFDKSFQLRMLLETKQNSNTWGTDQVIKFITDLKKMVHKTYTTVPVETETKTASKKAKRVLSKATNTVTERIIKSLQDSLTAFNLTVAANVTYDTKKADVVLDKVVEAAIGQTNANDIKTDIHVRRGAILEAIKNEQVEITPEIKQFIHEVSITLRRDAYEGETPGSYALDLVDAVLKANKLDINFQPTSMVLESMLLKIISKGSKNERTDLVAGISLYLSSINKTDINSKLYFIPVTTSSQPYFKEGNEILAQVESEFLENKSILDILNGKINSSELPTIILDSLPTIDNIWYKQSIHHIINRLIHQTSKGRFGITLTGTLIKLEHGVDNVISELVNTKTNLELFKVLEKIRNTKSDKLLRLRDLFKVDLGVIGNIPIAFTNSSSANSGYYNMHNNFIMLNLSKTGQSSSGLDTMLHEMVHSVSELNIADSRLRYLNGGSGYMYTILNPELNSTVTIEAVTKLQEYVKSNFPIIYNMSKVYSDPASNLSLALYYLHFDENTARSTFELYPYSSLGFSTVVENNSIYLVAPNNDLRILIHKTILPQTSADFNIVNLTLVSALTQIEHLDNLILPILNANSLEEARELAVVTLMPYITNGINIRNEILDTLYTLYDKVVADTIGQDNHLITEVLEELVSQLATPNTTSNYNKQHKTTLTKEQVLFQLINTTISRLIVLQTSTLDYNNKTIVAAVKSLIKAIKTDLFIPLQQANLAQKILSIVTSKVIDNNQPASKESSLLSKSFNFGEYSLVKHTGRSYMLTKQVGNGRYLTQEVAMDTLLPIRPNQSPLIVDQAQRDKMLFVIAKKTEVAKTKQPELPEPEKKTELKKVKEGTTVFQWGAWTVKEFDKEHYTVSKNIDKTGLHKAVDDDYSDEQFEAIQVVSKKTLLPDTMLGATGKPILSATERDHLLDWIEHNTAPEIFKVNPDTPEERYIYKPNLTPKPKSEATELKEKEAFYKLVQDYTHPLFQHLPGNVTPDYKLGLDFAKKVAEFYKKYPVLRQWVEGEVRKDIDQEIAARNSKQESLQLLYTELYKNTYGKTGTYTEFLKTPIVFIRTMDNNKPKLSLLNSVSLGYDLSRVPIFGNDGDYVYFGSILPTQLTTYLPISYAEGLISTEVFAKQPPVKYAEFKAFIRQREELTKKALPPLNLEKAADELSELSLNNFEDEVTANRFVDKYADYMEAELESSSDADTWKVTTEISNEIGRLILQHLPIRQFTPKEAARLMGVRDLDYMNMAQRQSKTSLLHLAGDSIVVPILQSIFNNAQQQGIITKPIRLIEFFAGYGSQNLALKYNKAEYESWKIAEWAINSIIAYKDMHHPTDHIDYSKSLTKAQLVEYFADFISRDYNAPLTKGQVRRLNEDKLRTIYNAIKASKNLVNVTKIKGTDLDIRDTNKHDYLLTYSFPCQDLSAAGTRAGLAEGTRSGLLWEVERILKELHTIGKLPKMLVLENVTQLHNKTNMPEFIKWQNTLTELGYTNSWTDLKATNFDVPQTRVRTFMVSVLGAQEFVFDKGTPTNKSVKSILEPTVDNHYFLKTFNWITNKAYADSRVASKFNAATSFNINKTYSSTLLTQQYKQPGFANLIADNAPDNVDILRYLAPKSKAEYELIKDTLKSKGKLPPLLDEIQEVEASFEPINQEFEMPRNKRTYIQPSRAKKNSSLVNFYNRAKAKGRNLQMHDDVLAFVEGTSEHFNELSKFFQVRIQNGTLTRQDITEYVATAKISTINEYTWKALLKYIYKNPALEAIGPNMIQFLIDPVRLEKLAIIARMTEDPDSLNRTHTVASLQKLIKDFNAKIKARDPEFIKAYEKAERSVRNWYTYDETGLVKDDWIMKENQIFPIFLSLYQGTLKSLNSIFSYAKVISAKQEATVFKGEAGTEGHDNANANKTTKISSGNAAVENNNVGEEKGKGPYNWAAHVRENIFDYEVTGYMPEEVEEIFTSIEEMTDDQKFNLIYTYLYDSTLNYIADRKPTEQEEAEANNDVLDIMENMTDDQIYNTIRYILDEKIRAYQTKKAKEADRSEKDALTAPSAERKVLKDHLRNKINLLISKLAGSKVAYNNLPTELKPLIDFTPTKSKANVDAYTNLTNPELETLANTISSEITRINKANQKLKELEKTKATIAKKVEALHKKQQSIKEREAKVKAREQAIKEGKNLRGKINLTFDAKIQDQTFTITGPSQINPKLQAIFNRTWAKQSMSKVKYMDDSAQTVQNIHIASEFYKEHADDLGAMSLAEIEDITDWLIEAHINTSGPAKQTFEAIQFFLLAYVYNQTDVGKGLFAGINANLKQKLESHLKSIQTSAGTLLSLIKSVKDKLHPAKIITVELFNRFEYVLSDAEQDMIDKAFAGGDTVEITKVLHTVKTNALANLTPEKATALRKIAAIRGMSMVSSPMTWIRNITSNYMLSGLNRTSTKMANAFLPKLTAKTANTPTQYRLNVPVTEAVQDFIKTQFVESGFFDETLDQISKYNPSQVLRHKKAGEQDIIEDMLIHSIYNHFYSESMFDSKILNHIHSFLMKRLSDKNFVRAAAVRYLGKLLSETKHHLDANGNIKTGIDKEIMEDVANAFALATTDYMHSDNFFSHLERWLSQHSPEGWAFFKTIMPFATASWNWFKAAIKYSPIGLAQSIVRLTRLEKEIIKAETLWQKGESQIAPELTVYTLTRNLGSGVIGTIAFGFGAILAALGYVSLEDDDWGTPKLVVGNLRVDISSIFGSSSVLAGMAFIDTLNKKKFSMAQLSAALDDMLDPLVDGFFFTDLLLMDANSPKGWFEFGMYQLQSIALSFIPSMARYVSGVTYTGNYRANNFFQRAVARLPFLGQAFNVPKKVDIYTGDDNGTMWDIVHRLLPYFEIVTKSQNQTQTEMYGLNKEELNGTYVINGQSFKTSPAETARINKLYGELNADALTAFYANQTSYRVLTDANRYVLKRYAQMTPTEISNALDQIFSHNSEIAKISAWLEAGHTYYTNDRDIFNMMRQLGYTNVYLGNKGFVD